MPDIAMENKRIKKWWNAVKEYWPLSLKLLIASAVLNAITPKMIASDAGQHVAELFSDLHIGWFVILVGIICVIQIVYKVVSKIRKGLRPTGKFLMVYGFILANYFFYYRVQTANYLEGFDVGMKIYYSDLMTLTLPIIFNFFVQKKRKVEASKDTIHFHEDRPTTPEENGTHANQEVISKLASAIINTTPDNSFSIAVTGSWGSGKSTFLKYLQNEISKQDTTEQNIVMEFSPLELIGSADMFRHFFSELINKVKDKDGVLFETLKKFYNIINGIDDSNMFVKVVKGLIGNENTNDLNQLRNNVNDELRNKGHRIIIFMDDLDRLNGEEILAVFRLIRGVADFKNTFFITAFDSEYVKGCINKKLPIKYDDTYIDKFFQHIVVLRPVRKNILLSTFRKLLLDSKEWPDKQVLKINTVIGLFEDRKEITKGIDTCGIFEKHITTIRDIKKLANSVSFAYDILGENIDLYSLILVEIIKIKYPMLYDDLSNYYYVMPNIKRKNYFEVDTASIKEYGNRKPFEIAELLKTTFSLYDNVENSIASTKHFPIYFYYHDIDTVSANDWIEFIGFGLRERISTLNQWIGISSHSDTVSIIVNRFKNLPRTNVDDYIEDVETFLSMYNPYIDERLDFIDNTIIILNQNKVFNIRINLIEIIEKIIKSHSSRDVVKFELIKMLLLGYEKKRNNDTIYLCETLCKLFNEFCERNTGYYKPIIKHFHIRELANKIDVSLYINLKGKIDEMAFKYLESTKQGMYRYLILLHTINYKGQQNFIFNEEILTLYEKYNKIYDLVLALRNYKSDDRLINILKTHLSFIKEGTDKQPVFTVLEPENKLLILAIQERDVYAQKEVIEYYAQAYK